MCLYCGGSCVGLIAYQAILAHGRTAGLTRLNTAITVVTIAAMGTLLPFGLNGVAAGLSVGAVVGAIYGLRLVHTTVGFDLRDSRGSVLGPLLASIVMAAVVYPLEAFVLHASNQGTVLALLLIAAESLVAAVIYLGALRLFSPISFSDLVSLLSRRLGRHPVSPAMGE